MKSFYKKMGLGILFVITGFIIASFMRGYPIPEEISRMKVSEKEKQGEIILIGERHGVKAILDKEAEIWGKYYNKGYRNLFIETSFSTAQYLNRWMKEKDDQLLDEVFNELQGTASGSKANRTFYKQIKARYPKTIFHGTDIGHQYLTIGARYMSYLLAHHMEHTDEFKRTAEDNAQGEKFYNIKNRKPDDPYREKMMTQNFIHTFSTLEDKRVVGIYGAYHTTLQKEKFTMLSGLEKVYQKKIEVITLVK